MLKDLLAKYPIIPDVWGEGAIFAFSGLDGETNAASGFVATYARDPYGLLIHTPTRRFLDVALPDIGTPRIAVGDVLAVQTAGGELLMAYAAWHTLVGLAPQGATLRLRWEEGPEVGRADGIWLTEDVKNGDALALIEEPGRFVLAYGRTADEAVVRARAGLHLDAWAEAAERLALYQRLPQLSNARDGRLLRKAFSVMKVNTLAAEGPMRQTWSTPDRVPHKDMWLWDSVFHSLAMNRFDPRISWHLLKGVLDTHNADGMIPHQSSLSGWKSQITQPPLLAWGVWENYQALRDRSALEYALPILESYLNWDLTHRDRNQNGLLEWWIEGNVRSRAGESGLDNSSRFDKAVPLDAVDFSTWAALDMHYLNRIAGELGEREKGQEWARRGREMSRRVHEHLWNPQAGFYFDREMGDGSAPGEFSPVWAVSGLMPLLLTDLPGAHLGKLLAALRDPRRFNTAFPVGSLAVSEPAFSTDMWRGPTWANLNYLVILGLRRQGQDQLAKSLTDKMLLHIEKYYERYGVLFEFYDSKDETPPPLCDRKGPHVEPYNIRRKMDSIRDYHWTAAVTALLLGW